MAAWLRFAGQRVSQPRWAGASRVVLGLAAAVVCLMSSSSVPAVAQQAEPDRQMAHRTAWGDPDLMGVWDFRSLTPLQRPAAFEG